jgi:hypothetical protein
MPVAAARAAVSSPVYPLAPYSVQIDTGANPARNRSSYIFALRGSSAGFTYVTPQGPIAYTCTIVSPFAEP